MGKNREYENFAEIGTFLHVNDGEAYTKSYTSVNEPLRTDSAKLTKKVGSVKVRMLVEEDRGVQKDGSFYTKSVWNEQERDGGNSPSTGYKTTQQSEYYNDPQTQNKPVDNNEIPAWGKVLKNFVDKIKDENNTQWILIAIIGIVAGIALGLAAL